MRKALVLVLVGLVAGSSAAHAAPRKKKPPPDKPEAKTPEQKEADRHFKSGVALFKEAKYAEALAEFERANEIAPNPIVLYNIAGCHRELSHYREAVSTYRRFLEDGKGKVPAARLAAAQSELDGILSRVARVTVTVTPALDETTLALDGTPLDKPEMPLIVPPGEHRLVAHAAGRRDAEKSLRVASGDELTVDLALAELPPPVVPEPTPAVVASPLPPRGPRRLALSAGFGTNLRQLKDTGAPSLGFGVAIGRRLELAVDGTLVAYSVMPSLRIRLAGDRFSLHLIGSVPIAFNDGTMSQTFVSGAGGLGLGYRPTPGVAFRIESLASYAGKAHGTTFPTFLRGELWF